ncbi:MAG: hypothetical protein IIZ55_06370 [Firmicutes bacterium]|nr:hypothetical protein [Bacillota bacterium]
MKPARTYEEFKAIIWDQVLKEGVEGGWDEADLRAYLEREAGDVSYSYNKALRDYYDGKTTYEQFTIGIPAGIAFNLEMCY